MVCKISVRVNSHGVPIRSTDSGWHARIAFMIGGRVQQPALFEPGGTLAIYGNDVAYMYMSAAVPIHGEAELMI